MRVLIVDDDPTFCEVVQSTLESAGMEVECTHDAASTIAVLDACVPGCFDVILLDVLLRGTSGWDLFSELRQRGNDIPVLFVSARSDVDDLVRGLRLGADDYITKPFRDEELIARIESAVRRHLTLPRIEFGLLSIDLATRRIRAGECSIELSPREFDVLWVLVQAKGRIVSREELLGQVWDLNFEPGTNVVNVHIARLRRKLEGCDADVIETVRGEGYRAVLKAQSGGRCPCNEN
jgi:two-component system OmpR family response regulator